MLTDKRIEYRFDDNLKEVPCDPQGLRDYLTELEKLVLATSDSKRRVGLLGELGVHLRCLGDLNDAEARIAEALRIIDDNQLGIKWEVQQKIRLAHIIQWKKQFHKSDALFADCILICRSNLAATPYLDFALQHAGKNFFDQNRFAEALAFFEESIKLRLQRKAPVEQMESSRRAIERTQQLLKLSP
jgi:tetratricopeptide (TPR) repeat protein